MESDNYYFDSYSYASIHKEMLSDKIRTLSYKEAIMKNSSLFKEKIILDVGSGTGILAMFAAQAGAKRVYAVENSSIVEKMKEIIKDNGFSNKIIVLKGRIEDVEIPEKVDVIISEWMGYCLLFESMLNSVIFARDRYMQATGTMFPSSATMRICGITDKDFYERKFNRWNNVCGFNMSPFRKWSIYEPLIAVASEDQIITDECLIAEFDLNKCKEEELIVPQKEFSLTSLEENNMLYGICCFFDVTFSGPEATVILTTSPFNPPTHWSQTIFFFDEPIKVQIGQEITGVFDMKPSPYNYRDQDITITLNAGDTHITQNYRIR